MQREADLAQYEEEQQAKADEEAKRQDGEAKNPKPEPTKAPYEAKELPQKESVRLQNENKEGCRIYAKTLLKIDQAKNRLEEKGFEVTDETILQEIGLSNAAPPPTGCRATAGAAPNPMVPQPNTGAKLAAAKPQPGKGTTSNANSAPNP